jgi:hypothetical protein
MGLEIALKEQAIGSTGGIRIATSRGGAGGVGLLLRRSEMAMASGESCLEFDANSVRGT